MQLTVLKGGVYSLYMLKQTSRLFFAVALLTSISCSAPKVDTFPSLANQGQLALSTTNPYLGSNLFIAKELEKSRYFFNFFKGRGAPTAIEILESSSSPTKILLFYPRDKEVYIADPLLTENDINRREWVVRGPYQIERQDFKNLSRMELAMNGEPVFEVRGKQHRFRFQKDEQTTPRVIVPLPPPIPTPRPIKKVKVITAPENKEPSQRDFRPLNTDQQALNMAKGFAERSLVGDVVHTVKVQGQTISDIARWYTGAATNGAKLAALNTVSATEGLNAGTRVTIPLDMVKEFKQMP